MTHDSNFCFQPGPHRMDLFATPAKQSATPEGTADEPVQGIPTVDRHLLAADEAIEKRQYERAISELACALQLDSSRADAFARRGDVWRALGHTDEAIADYTASLNLDPERESIFLARGQILLFAGRPREA